MFKKTEKKLKKKPSKGKLVVCTLLLTVGFSTSVNVAFANEDISAMLSSWFDQKTNESISDIETAINEEKTKSMETLKQELKVEMKDAEMKLNAYTEQEKQKRVDELKQYTEQLISDMQSMEQVEKDKVQKEIDVIIQEAKQKIDNIQTSVQSDNNKEVPNEQNVENQNVQQEEDTSK